ncbi:MAG: histone deacetylase [Chloroflexia bacterium]|nr:histone deacetylase [Chloroflexia bacterium]
MPNGLVYSERYLEHDEPTHPENAGRLRAIVDVLREQGAWDESILLTPHPISPALLTRLHQPSYVDLLQRASTSGGGWLDADTYVTPASYEVALLAAGGAIRAVDAVLDDEVSAALALIRPPGHHARPSQGMGFCLFNNVALAALHALEERGLSRVLIVDWDVHHGNGTQDAFYDDGRVLFFSTHQSPYYPGSGAVGETGAGAGEGCIVNVPLPPGFGDAGYERVFDEILLPLAEDFGPEIILLSAGFDAHWIDPLAGMDLSIRGYARMASTLHQLAQRHCPDRLVMVLEGGYDPRALGYGVLATYRAWQGADPATAEDPLGPAPRQRPADDAALERIVQAARQAHGLAAD